MTDDDRTGDWTAPGRLPLRHRRHHRIPLPLRERRPAGGQRLRAGGRHQVDADRLRHGRSAGPGAAGEGARSLGSGTRRRQVPHLTPTATTAPSRRSCAGHGATGPSLGREAEPRPHQDRDRVPYEPERTRLLRCS
ncbi:hypothetical protein HBB16_11250 [Pseudonocardia sp. MCCB 268]|nr:hypothetical protein [Pseudonocardia cytotoxica]